MWSQDRDEWASLGLQRKDQLGHFAWDRECEPGRLEGLEGGSQKSFGCRFHDLGCHTIELPLNSWVFGVDVAQQCFRNFGGNMAGGTRSGEKGNGRDRGVSNPKSSKLLFIFSNEMTFTFESL